MKIERRPMPMYSRPAVQRIEIISNIKLGPYNQNMNEI